MPTNTMSTTMSNGIVEIKKGNKNARINLLEKYKVKNPDKFISKGLNKELEELLGKPETKIEEKPKVGKPANK